MTLGKGCLTERYYLLAQKSSALKKEDIIWLVGQTGLVLTAVFFFYFGIQVLLSAFALKEPFSFILTFFASNFIILISATLLAGFLIRINAFFKGRKKGSGKE